MKNYYIFQQGTLDADDESLRFTGQDSRKIPREQIDSVHIFAGFTLTSGALKLATASEFPVHIYGYYGNYMGSYIPKNAPESAERLLAQLRSHDNKDTRLSIAKSIISSANSSMNNILRFLGLEQMNVTSLKDVTNIEALRLEEARLRKEYYAILDTYLPDYYMLISRTRHPPSNAANCLLGFWNGIIYAQTVSTLYRAGIDPRIGYLHGDMRAPNPLALDMAELYKAYLSELLLIKVSKEAPKTKWFTTVGEGVYLNDQGKKEAVKLFDQQLGSQVNHIGVTRWMEFREAMVVEAYRLEKKILGITEYNPLVVECTSLSSTTCR